MTDQFRDKRIGDLVQEHYAFAYVLFSFGVEYVEHHQKTLSELCDEKNLHLEGVVNTYTGMYVADEQHTTLALERMPIERVLRYLRHHHLSIVSKRIPFLKQLIGRLSANTTPNLFIREIEDQFPLFADDLLSSIYEEEEVVFEHVLSIRWWQQSGELPGYTLMELLNKVSIAEVSETLPARYGGMLHPLRDMTGDFSVIPDVRMKVLMDEFRLLDRELQVVNRVKESIFYPKAVLLESQMERMLLEHASNN